MPDTFFEDFEIGAQVATGTVEVTADAIKAFARSFDPQVFHLDETAATATFFGELVASGWHTAGLVMRLLVDADILGGHPLIGAGVDALRWPQPTRPGDRISAVAEIIGRQESRSRPDRGVLRLRISATNQAGAVVQSFEAVVVVPRRSPMSAVTAPS